MAIVVVIAGSYYGYAQLSDNKCSGSVRLTVAAAPEIAPAIDQTAQRWVKDGANVSGTCVAITVNPVIPATMASAIAAEHKVTLTGLGAPGAVKVPDVWVSDSATWLLRLRSEAPGFTPTDNKPLAQSPVVVAMPEPVAQQIGWPDKKLGWKDLLALLTSNTQLRTGIVDPTRDASGLSGLLALGEAAGAGTQAQALKVAAIKALAQGSSSLRDALLQNFPQSADPNTIATSLSAAPLSEQDVVSYNAQKPAVPLVALYMEPNPPPLDYPYAVLPEVDVQKQQAAEGLRAQLQTATFKNELASAGLRAPDGSVGAGFAKPLGAPTASPAVSAPAGNSAGTAASGLDASALSQAIGSWAAITLPGRVLSVFDVSGSMKTKVPTANNLTRAQVTQQAAAGGLALFDDKWAVGVWLFSTDMDGTKPYKQIVPISPLSAARQKLQQSISLITPKSGGNTGLYDTVLAAYKNVQSTWQAGKVNSVILFTDGKNDNPGGITRGYLIDQLHKLNDPKRPVRVVIIGIGNEVDPGELQAITNATPAGGVFVAEDPAKIGPIFLEAIADRSGAGS